MTRPLCLITGASAGIGAAFARTYAAHGWDVALTARRTERLKTLGEDLESEFGAASLIVPGDLSDPRTPGRIVREIGEQGRRIDGLVNNAGFGLPGAYTSSDWDAHRDFIQLMITAPSHLARLVLPGMRERGFGRIVNIASVAGYAPGAKGHTLYGASKAYLIKMSQSLHLENRHKGVHVTALSPGFTYSEFHDVNATREMVGQTPKWMWQDAEEVAEAGYEACEANIPMRVPGLHNKIIVALSRVLPEPLALSLMARQSDKIRKAA